MTTQLIVGPNESALTRTFAGWPSGPGRAATWLRLGLRPETDAGWNELFRRALNVSVAVLGIVVMAPLMLLIAVLIKLTSPGPVLYVQTRVGLDRRTRARRLGDGGVNGRRHRVAGGVPFRIYKFRTMRVDGDTGEQRQVWACPDDPRITPVGAVLRRLRLDELPQLFNVLQGDMNVVGPRPEQPRIFQRLTREVPGYTLRQMVRPGITGWAQINQHYDTSVEDVRRKVAYDLEYIARRGALEDLRMMLQTLPVMLGRRGGW